MLRSVPSHFAIWTFLVLFQLFNQYLATNGQYMGSRQRLRGNIPARGYEPKKLHPCEQSSCYPATGNLLIGREDQLFASSTCGLHGQQRYCIVSHLEERKKCFWCDSRPTIRPNPLLNHNISNIVYRNYPGTRQKSWWQSENGKENVFIQLDLEAEFHFTHLIITFKTFRPAAMLIERSYDFKQSWQVYRYFAQNCTESFPGVREGLPKNLTDVVCESRYSGIAPATDGEVIYRVLPPGLPIDNPYSEQVQNLLKMTNLRINFTKLHTLGDDLLDRREEIQEKYYYAITDMTVRGSCSCYGHANRCLPLAGIDPKPDMVHGRCECTHNTKGRNCEKCEDFFNDLPWRPAIGKQTNACKRCNCNNHATSCHFDAALYEATGHVSGGVCDGCSHNTMGPNCEQCKPFFYRDPLRDIQDPEVCRPCDCDPHGSLDGGICDSLSDNANGIVAGSCHCKKNVEGRRCDVCKNGFWNFTDVNPDGCQPCTCNTFGTIDNQGCNVYTGECTCKRYVTGRDCNQCLPEYFGLSEKRDGCQPCDCDPGGSFDNFCDVVTGQCRCRDHMTDRRCNVPKQQHFTASIDFLLFESETSQTNGQVVIREQYRDGKDDTWTGIGFIKAHEGAYIEFSIDGIRTSMDYDIVIRYEPKSPDSWEEVGVTVIRPGPNDPNGPCARSSPEDDIKSVGLPANSRSVVVFPPACLEAGKTYKIRLDFRRSNYERENPSATVLIDSITLIPRIDTIPWFHGSATAETRREEYERNHCALLAYNINPGPIPEVCKKYQASIGAYVFNGALQCQCDPTGSHSKFCDPYGGYCKCKPNVVGRRCDRCAPGTYDFGPEGCKACDCNSIGALDNFCNATTGQCKCRANTYGRECDQCRTGFWRFPNCERCDCNGHADICESKTGVCINCRDNTMGDHCEQCIKGYYGDPQINIDIPCRPCPCPGPPSSNHSYADSCSLDPATKDVICECLEGYGGSRCDVCDDNYYGNPEVPGGSCRPCNCNGQIDVLSPGNCDPHTGKCLKCLYETTGDHCEVCRPGFFRYTPDRMCEECTCHILGTNSSAGPCDPNSGQCICLPNVSGLKCDECIENHWKIASGEGCEPCGCDFQGSLSPQCNKFDGQCECKPGFGGRQCNECMATFWGDPKVECRRCECDRRGSKTLQCDRKTGACVCEPGIGGYNCDRCARGYIGYSPNCSPCGECFENWDRNLQELRNKSLDIINRAKDIKKVGATGAYTKEFEDMQWQLNEIDQLLNHTELVNVDDIESELEMLRKQINETDSKKLKNLINSLDEMNSKIYKTNITVNDLASRIEELKNKTKELENNGTRLQETNILGALHLIENAKTKADRAAGKAEHSQADVKYAETQCKATETHINRTEQSYKKQLEDNEKELQNIRDKIHELSVQIPELNNMVCDGNGDPCDSICGGAGCGSCGNSISCEHGAKQQAETANTFTNNTITALKKKETMANDFIRNVSQINTNETKNIAQELYDDVLKKYLETNETLNKANDLLNQIRPFFGDNITKPEQVKKLGEEILAKNIQQTPEKVKELDRKIKEAVKNLPNIDDIIRNTQADTERVKQLKEDAEYAKGNATKLKEDADEITKSLEDSKEAQKEAEEAIAVAVEDYSNIEGILKEIANETAAAQENTVKIKQNIDDLGEMLMNLQNNITNNGIYANRVVNESVNIISNAKKTNTDYNELQNKYGKAKNDLNVKLEKATNFKDRSNELFTMALDIAVKVTKTQEEIEKLEKDSQGSELEKLENQLQDLIRKMNDYNNQLEHKVQYYKVCN